MYENEIQMNNLEEQEIFEGFKGEGISVQKIGEHLFKTGVLVKLVIGRIRLKYSYDFKGFGIDFEKTSSNDFVMGHMENGKISVLPLHLEKRLSSIEGSLRNRQKRLATGFGDQFMPIDSYVEFKKDFETTRGEFFMVRDEILDIWDNLVNDYKTRLAILLQDLNAIERDHLFDQMIYSIPSKEDYRNSFKMFMSVKTMPKVDGNNDLNDEINAIISRDIVSVIIETVQNCLEKACKLADSAIAGYKNGEISIRTVGAIKTISTTLRTRNIAANNPKIAEIADLFDEAANSDNRDDMASIMEIIMAKGVVYAKNNNIQMNVKSTLSMDDLIRINSLS